MMHLETNKSDSNVKLSVELSRQCDSIHARLSTDTLDRAATTLPKM
jgi:hypothetical protein